MTGRELYGLGELPPLGEVPPTMHAQVVRPDRYGRPDQAFRAEVVPTPMPRRGEVLVLVMAAGLNYNNVWAALGAPLDVIAARRRRGEPEDYHIGGSDAAGIVWAVGEDVRRVRVGDEVVLTGCRWDEHAEDIRSGADPVTSTSQQSWGYELNHGSFAQFTRVAEYQCLPKPARLGWAEAACFMVSGVTAYRQLFGWPPHAVRPGDVVLVWGAAGGLGSMAVQLVRQFGGLPVAVVSTPDRAEYCRKLGAAGVIDRTGFDHWGPPPDPADGAGVARWLAGARAFRRRLCDLVGERPRVVFEHSGRDTLATSLYVCDNAGMVVLCGATSGYHATVDLRFLWMRQKRLQGSHYANLRQCRELTRLVADGRVDPCLSVTVPFRDTGALHQRMHDNDLPPGNAAVLVNATAEH